MAWKRDDWNDIIQRVNALDCIDSPLPLAEPDHIWTKNDIQTVKNKLNDICTIQKYLKHAEIDGIRCQCRVAACRLRGEPSFGFIIPAPDLLRAHPLGSDVSVMWAARKYEPPVRYFPGDLAPEDSRFHQYTEIENIWRFPDAFPDGMPVRITSTTPAAPASSGTTAICFVRRRTRARTGPTSRGRQKAA